MDNKQIDIVTEGNTDAIREAIGFAWDRSERATHYRVVSLAAQTRYYVRRPGERDKLPPTVSQPEPLFVHHSVSTEEVKSGGQITLILLHGEEQGAAPLPFPLGRDEAAQFIAGWLGSVNYGREPDHDGDNGKGWRVFTEGWGRVAGHHYAIVGVQPVWAMYGK